MYHRVATDLVDRAGNQLFVVAHVRAFVRADLQIERYRAGGGKAQLDSRVDSGCERGAPASCREREKKPPAVFGFKSF
eukprot:COSAG06_NODE_6576_length_2873_cov_2.600216_3_plen_78_part_00